MEKEQIRAFIYRIATEPGYRAQLEQDPVGTFAEWGITVDHSELPAGGIHLPSNEDLLAALDAFVATALGQQACDAHFVAWLSR